MSVPAAQMPQPKRMSLSLVTRGRIEKPFRVVMFSPEGVGKTTFAANAPAPIFIGTEDGALHLDVARFPKPQNWGDIMEAVRTLDTDPHEYKTLVLDTLDWAEPLCWAQVVENAPKNKAGQKPESIEEIGGGFGKGYLAALDLWRQFLAALERLQTNRQMNIILLAHSILKVFRNPEGDDFDRYQMKFNDKASGLIREWCDELLFANFETFADKDSKTKRIRGVSAGNRLIYTIRRAAFDAKTRSSVPDMIPLDWSEFEKAARAHKPADPDVLIAEITAKAAQVGGQVEKDTLASLGRCGRDSTKLAMTLNWVAAKLVEKETK